MVPIISAAINVGGMVAIAALVGGAPEVKTEVEGKVVERGTSATTSGRQTVTIDCAGGSAIDLVITDSRQVPAATTIVPTCPSSSPTTTQP